VGISHSGAPARAVEAMRALARAGARTLALTGDPESPMARAAGRVLEVSVPPFAPAPGIRSFAAAQLALYLLAVRFAEAAGRITMDQAGAYRRALQGAGAALQTAYERTAEAFRSFSETVAACGRLELLGAGACQSCAAFGAAKLVEATGMAGVPQDAEEFAHTNFFRREPRRIPTLLFAPSLDPSFGRCRELAMALRTLGRPFLALTDGAADIDGALSAAEKPVEPLFAPLLYSCLAGFLISLVDGGPDCAYFRGHAGPWSEEDFPDVKNSGILVL